MTTTGRNTLYHKKHSVLVMHAQLKRSQPMLASSMPPPSRWGFTLIFCIALNMAGCGVTPSKPSSGSTTLNFGTSGKPTPQQSALSRHYKSWIHTRYKLGGLSKAGIDCSGFVHVTYRDVFNKKLPRSTRQLAKTGKAVTQESLKLGDLVFFKTGRSKRHVGIYINNGKFIHASTSRGVMQSSLRTDYWSKHYWKAQRVF